MSKIQRTEDTLTIELKLLKYEENNYHICYSPELELMSFGDTDEEAESNLQATVVNFLETEQAKNRLDATMKKLGWTKKKTNPANDLRIPLEVLSTMAVNNFKLHKIPVSVPCHA